jgi:hypothetical protein
VFESTKLTTFYRVAAQYAPVSQACVCVCVWAVAVMLVPFLPSFPAHGQNQAAGMLGAARPRQTLAAL